MKENSIEEDIKNAEHFIKSIKQIKSIKKEMAGTDITIKKL